MKLSIVIHKTAINSSELYYRSHAKGAATCGHDNMGLCVYVWYRMKDGRRESSIRCS
jgi:hypothetical protein